MIIGDPYKIAVIVQVINEWSETWINGVFMLTINGKIIPEEIFTSTLECDCKELNDNLDRMLSCPPVDMELYELDGREAFIKMYNLTCPNNADTDNDYRYKVSTSGLEDNDYWVFAVNNGSDIRFIASKLIFGDNVDAFSVDKMTECNVSVNYLSALAAGFREITSLMFKGESMNKTGKNKC